MTVSTLDKVELYFEFLNEDDIARYDQWMSRQVTELKRFKVWIKQQIVITALLLIGRNK